MISAADLNLDHPFTTDMARRHGITCAEVNALVSCGRLRRLFKGVYVAASTADTLEMRVEALKLVVPPDAVVCDETAGWLHGAPMILAPNSDIETPLPHVFVNDEHRRLRNCLVHSGQRVMRDEHIVDLGGLRVTDAVRTAMDLGRLRAPVIALGAIDSLMRRAALTREELHYAATEFKGYRGVRQLRRLIEMADPGSQSPGESAVRYYWRRVDDAPMPETQIEVPTGWSSYWLDVGSEPMRYAVEYDGDEWHNRTDKQREHDRTKRSHCSDQGWDVDVVTKRNVFGKDRDIELVIAKGIKRARRRRGLS